MKRTNRQIGALAFGTLLLSPFAAHSVNEALQKQMLSHVQKITVVDSILVDRDNFLKTYRLHHSAGRLLSSSELREAGVPPTEEIQPEVGFTNEFGDYMLWAQTDTAGVSRLAQRVKLIDGSWSPPELLPAVLNFSEEWDPEDEEERPEMSSASYPFMLDDGITLYYASDGPESLGGYDIFEAQRDPSDGSYLKPRNLGMPFNSPFDDYMMAIDTQTGVGWWVSDRNQLEDHLTLYIYQLADERINVDPQDENLMIYATLEGWQEVQTDEERETAQNLKKEIAAIRASENRQPDFTLLLLGGKRYNYFSDFKNSAASAKMRTYIELKKKVESQSEALQEMRNQYFLSGKDKRMEGKIAEAEKSLREEESRLQTTLSDIIRLESSK